MFTNAIQLSALLASAFTAGAAAGWDRSLYATSPPVYPSPEITGAGGWNEALLQARDFLANLTTEEKTWVLTGANGPCVGNIAPIERVGFKGLCLQDGPAAIRAATFASVFPAGVATAASWDRDLIYQRGLYMGAEFKAKGSHIALAPVCGPLGRSPWGGRNWEGFSPDQYLTGVAVAESVRGIQAAGVQATTKHYIGNEQEEQRNPTQVNGTTVEAISSNIDDRTMHETYLWPFYDAIHAGSASVMCSYNRINGSYGCQNSKTLNGLLKEELGFQGYVMSDWGGVHSGVDGIQAGLDMNMPGGISFVSTGPSFWGENITTAIANGTLPEARVDDMILRVMTPYYFLGQDKDFPLIDESSAPLTFFPRTSWQRNFSSSLGPIVDAREDHASFIQELGAASTVLLKNENSALPLQSPKNIAVFGYDAADLGYSLYGQGLSQTVFGTSNSDFGTLASGGGSGSGRFTSIVAPLEAIKARAAQDGTFVQYILSHDLITRGNGISLLAPAPPDVCLVFLKSWATEGEDRYSLIPDYDSTALVQNVTSACANTVVILHGAGPAVLPWADNANVTAILAAHFPGEQTGPAIVDVLYGDVNPSGHLPYTVAYTEADYTKNIVNSTELVESTDPNAWQADFTEGQLIDYREFDAQNKSVQYPFGFGLSYTSFSLSDLLIPTTSNSTSRPSRTPSADAPILPGGNAELWDVLVTITATLENTGDVADASVPQLYISLPQDEAAPTPPKQLRGFEKVYLEAGESQTVSFELKRRDLSYWDVNAQAWTLPTGSIGVKVGWNARDLVLEGSLSI